MSRSSLTPFPGPAARLQVLGPMRFRSALKEGMQRGAFRKVGRNYAPERSTK